MKLVVLVGNVLGTLKDYLDQITRNKTMNGDNGLDRNFITLSSLDFLALISFLMMIEQNN